MQNIQKGKIVSIDKSKSEVRVQSVFSENSISMKLGVPKHININELSKDDLVAYVIFEDQTGLVFSQI